MQRDGTDKSAVWNGLGGSGQVAGSGQQAAGSRQQPALEQKAAQPFEDGHEVSGAGYFSARIFLLPVAGLLTLVGYFGPWISHPAAGLTVLGLDLGELVKFLYPVQQGDIVLWREGFYMPLVAVSLALSVSAFRRLHPYRWPVRVAMLLVATVAALNLLPPAWSPDLLVTAEFRLQSSGLLLCLVVVGFSPFAGLLPGRMRGLLVTALAAMAFYFPLAQFRWILPALADLYGQSLTIGWGPWLMGLGLFLLACQGLLDLFTPELSVKSLPVVGRPGQYRTRRPIKES